MTTVKCGEDSCVHNQNGVCGCAEIVLELEGGYYTCQTYEIPMDDPVKDDCVKKNIQGCFNCKDYCCGDNLNPQMGSLADCGHDVTCSVCKSRSTAYNRHVFYKEAGKIKCCECLVEEDNAANPPTQPKADSNG